MLSITQGKSIATVVVNFLAIIPLSIVAESTIHEIQPPWRCLRRFPLYHFIGSHSCQVWHLAFAYSRCACSNFVQLVPGIFLLKGQQASVLQMSLIGGILGNLLLVLGASFFRGRRSTTDQLPTHVPIACRSHLPPYRFQQRLTCSLKRVLVT